MNVGIKGFPDSLAHESYRGFEIHVADGPFSRNGYVVAAFGTLEETSHELLDGIDITYDQIKTSAPVGWSFSRKRDDGQWVIGFDHGHLRDRDLETTHLPPETILEELQACVDELIVAGYIEEEVTG